MSDSVESERLEASTERVHTAVGWAVVMNAARLAATIGTSIVLAALLGPRAFGIVALGVIYVTLLQLLMQNGVMPAIIQLPNLTRRHLDSSFWLTMVISVVLAGFSLLFAGAWAELNSAPEARNVILALSSLVVIKGLVVVQEALLRRRMQFRALAIRTTAASVAGSAVGLTWAIIAPSLWALVAQQLITNLVDGVMLWAVSDWRPRFRFWAKEAKDVWSFAWRGTMSGFGVFVNNRIDALLVGLYFGASAVGLYRLAARLVESAIELTAQPIQQVALPDFSRNQADSNRTHERYGAFVHVSVAVGGTVMATMFATAEAFMATLGDEWRDATAALQFLTVVGLVRAITMMNAPAIQGVGRPGIQAVMTWLAAGLSAVSFVAAGIIFSGRGVDIEVAGMAASRALLYALVLLPISQVFIRYIIGVPAMVYARLVGPSLVVCVSAAIAGAIGTSILLNSGTPSIAVVGLIGGATLLTTGAAVLVVNTTARRIASTMTRRSRHTAMRRLR